MRAEPVCGDRSVDWEDGRVPGRPAPGVSRSVGGQQPVHRRAWGGEYAAGMDPLSVLMPPKRHQGSADLERLYGPRIPLTDSWAGAHHRPPRSRTPYRAEEPRMVRFGSS